MLEINISALLMENKNLFEDNQAKLIRKLNGTKINNHTGQRNCEGNQRSNFYSTKFTWEQKHRERESTLTVVMLHAIWKPHRSAELVK